MQYAMNPSRLLTHSLKKHPHGECVTRILAAALEAVEPARAVRQHLRREGDTLTIGEQTYDLTQFERVLVIAFGKAGLPMSQAAADVLGPRLDQGIVVTKSNPKEAPPILRFFRGGHPVPDERSLAASEAVLRLLSHTTPRDLVLCLISGGGSALLTAPVAGVTLDDLQSLTRSLLACGASIGEINTLRKHLSRVKGGRLAQQAAPARLVSLILSDVVGDPLDVIASGPTVPDPTTYQDALAILRRYRIANETPPAILAHLQRGAAGEIPETPKPGDPIFEGVQNVIVGNNERAARAAMAQAQAEGFHPLLLTTALQGEAREAGRVLAAILRQAAASGEPVPRPACILAGGETTVTLAAHHGPGGRNQELALGAVETLRGAAEVMLISLATDGEDGPTDAAGAVVTGETWGRAASRGLYPPELLARNAAYTFFDPLGDLLKPGATQTNVCDLVFLFAF